MPNLRRLDSGPYAGKLDMGSAECFPVQANYEVDISWDYVEDWISGHGKHNPIDLCPDFQRGHVWTRAQKRAFIEF